MRPFLHLLVAPLAALVLASPAQAAKITRGPYLQMGSDTAVTVVWRTNEPTTAKVEYAEGEGSESYDKKAESDALATQHEVRITGLKPSTRYRYAVGTDTERLGGGTEDYFFVTSPPAGTRTRFRAWVVGDSGTGNEVQAAVRDAMLRDVGEDKPDLYLHLGDMAYVDGTDEQFQMNFFDVYQPILRNTVVWPTIGNHEAKSSSSKTQSGPYYDAYVMPKNAEVGGVPSRTEAYYSFDYGHAHFIVLDSDDSPLEVDGPMLTWLAQDIAATTQDWIIAYMHHPPYSKGSHDSDTNGTAKTFRANVLPILEGGGVDLVLAGHSHIYERSYLLDSAYGVYASFAEVPGEFVLDAGDGMPLGDGPYAKRKNTAHDGTVYVVAGHGGANLGQKGVHPLMFTTEKTHGSALLDIDGDRLTLQNITATGERTDTFTLMKAPGLVLATPNGGETLKAGARHDIRWATKGDRPNVHLDVSFDGGKAWEAIADNVPNTGTYEWTVPAKTSTKTLVRVKDAADPDVSDLSDASFTVYTGDTPPERPNRAPFIVEMETYEGQAGTMVTQQLRGYDPDGDSLAWSVENMPPGGTMTGTYFFWIPTLQDAGVWHITFLADDGRGAVARSTWTVRLADEDGVVPEPEPEPEAVNPEAPDAGCGCAAAGSAGMLALVAVFAGKRRRRLGREA